MIGGLLPGWPGWSRRGAAGSAGLHPAYAWNTKRATYF